MTQSIVAHAEVVREQAFESGKLRALKASRRGRVRLFLEVNLGRMRQFLAVDDDCIFYCCSEYASEAELLTAFDRVAAALAR